MICSSAQPRYRAWMFRALLLVSALELAACAHSAPMASSPSASPAPLPAPAVAPPAANPPAAHHPVPAPGSPSSPRPLIDLHPTAGTYKNVAPSALRQRWQSGAMPHLPDFLKRDFVVSGRSRLQLVGMYKVCVNMDGRVVWLSPVQSLGEAGDAAVAEAVRDWTYAPGSDSVCSSAGRPSETLSAALLGARQSALD
jgi:hypothetical protein